MSVRVKSGGDTRTALRGSKRKSVGLSFLAVVLLLSSALSANLIFSRPADAEVACLGGDTYTTSTFSAAPGTSYTAATASTEAQWTISAAGVYCLAAGTYDVQIIIAADGVTLKGAPGTSSNLPESGASVVIRPSSVTFTTVDPQLSWGNPETPIIFADGGAGGISGVTVSGLIVDGSAAASTFPGCTGTDGQGWYIGILFSDASGEIANDTVENIYQSSPLYYGCQADAGFGIVVGAPNDIASTVTISGNTVAGYPKNGVTCYESGITCYISDNTISDTSAVTSEADTNGIQFGPSAAGSVTGNLISGNVYTGGGYGCDFITQDQGLGMLFLDNAAPITVSGNALVDNDIGIVMGSGDTSTITAASNMISGSTCVGALVYDESQPVSFTTFTNEPADLEAVSDSPLTPATATYSCDSFSSSPPASTITETASGGVASDVPGATNCNVPSGSNGYATISAGGATYDQTGTTGVSVTISGSTAPDGTGLAVATESLSSPSSGVASANLNYAKYFDVMVVAGAGDSDGTAAVCVNDGQADASTNLQYWSGTSSTWASAGDVVSRYTASPPSVCGDIPVSALGGSNIVAGDPPLTATETTTSLTTSLVTTTETLTQTSSTTFATTITTPFTTTATAPVTTTETVTSITAMPTTITMTKTSITTATGTSTLTTSATSTVTTTSAQTTTETLVEVLSLTCSHPSVVVGRAVRCQAAVDGVPPAPTGTFAWSSSTPGTFSSTTCTLTHRPGWWHSECSVLFTPTAANPSVVLTAQYGGNSRYHAASATYDLSVLTHPTVMTLTCKPDPVVAGPKVVTCKAGVVGYLPTGTVTFTQSSADGGAVAFTSGLTYCHLVGSSSPDVASCSVTMTGSTSGHVTISATYSGDSNNQPSSKSVGLTIRSP